MKSNKTWSHQKIPIIQTISSTAQRPLWSVMIPVYNCLSFLPQTLESVLIQGLSEKEMEIIVVDDCSTDGDVQKLVEEIGMGRIQYVRQATNVGSLKNFETCLNTSCGHLIHLLHGDDFVLEGYYQKMTALFQSFPHAGAAYCNFLYVDQDNNFVGYETKEQASDGLLENRLLKIAQRQRMQYCAVTVRREVYEKLGGFYGVHYGEDWEMWARIAVVYPLAYTPQPLACYRRHQNSISGQYLHTGQNIKDIKWVIEKIQHYLPKEQRTAAKKSALRFYARYTMAMAFSVWKRTRNKAATLGQVKQAFGLYKEPYLLWRLLWLRIKMLTGF